MSDRLAEIEARLGAATPGPWKARHRDCYSTPDDDETVGLGLEIDGPPEASLRGQFARGADAQLIAAAPTDLRDLLAVAKAAREFIEEYRDMNGGEEPGDGPTRRLAWARAALEGDDDE